MEWQSLMGVAMAEPQEGGESRRRNDNKEKRQRAMRPWLWRVQVRPRLLGHSRWPP